MRAFIIVQSVLLFLFLGCSTKPGTQNWVAPDIEVKFDSTLDCDDPAEPGCAVPSPFEALYQDAYDIAGGKAPHYVNLLNIGDRALLVRIHLIRSAKSSIDIQQFIWATDETASFIFKELVKAARRGVRVRIINDQLSAVGDARKVATAVGVHENLAIKIYNPTFDKFRAPDVT